MDEKNSSVSASAAPSFPSFIALRAQHSELLQREPDTEDSKEQSLKEVEHFIEQAEATGAILSDDEERRSSQSILNYWAATLYRHDQKTRLVTLADYDRRRTTEVGDVVCPYPGVQAFAEKYTPFFFGRQRQIAYMLGRLKEDRLLVIVGASGSGKTSLVQAGLLPALEKEQPNNLKHFFFPTTSPGSDPLMSLALMIQRAKKSADNDIWLRQQIKSFQQDTGHLLKLIEEITDSPAVIFIDQGEEMYERNAPKLLRPFENILDFDNSKKTVEPFLDNLVRVVKATNRKHIVIIARRIGDYEPKFNRLPSRVKEVFEPARVVLPALYASELSDTIQKPAELLGVKFEEIKPTEPNILDAGLGVPPKDSTVQALIKEISSEAVGLPLLQFVLPKLWEKREGNKIPDSAFREMGSCRATLRDTAENFYNSLASHDQRVFRRLMEQLVTLDGELKPHVYPVRRTTLYRVEKQQRIDDLIAGLERQQLIRVSRGERRADDWVELVHDSLITNWPRMIAWIKSKRWARRRSLAIKVVGLAAMLALVMVVAVLFIGWQQQRMQARDLAELSKRQFENDRFDLALLFGRQAYAVDRSPETEGNVLKLLYALQSTSHPKKFLYEKNFEVEDMTFSAETDRNPARLAALDNEGNIVIWNLDAKTIEKRLASRIAKFPLAFSPDGKKLVTGSHDPAVTLILWDLANDQPTNLVDPVKAPVTSLAFSPDSKTVVTGSLSGSVIQWDLASNEIKGTELYHHSDVVNTIAFNASGRLLASGSDDGRVMLADEKVKGNQQRTYAVRRDVKGLQKEIEDQRIISLAFNARDDKLALGTDGEAFIWDLSIGKRVTKFSSGPNTSPILVTFSEDGELLTAFSFEGPIILWDLNTERTKGKQFYESAAHHSASFSKNGQLLALPGDDGVVVWDVVTPRTVKPGSAVPAGSTVDSLAFNYSPDHQIMISRGEGSLTEWKIPSTEQRADESKSLSVGPREDVGSQIPVERDVSSLAFSRDGGLLALGLEGGTISLRDIKDYRETKALDAATGSLVKEGLADQAYEPQTNLADSAAQDPPVVSKLVFDPKPGSSRLAAVIKTGKKIFDADEDDDLGTKIIVWNTVESTATAVPTAGDTVVTSLAFGPDGDILAWGSANKGNGSAGPASNFRVLVWDGQKQQALPCTDLLVGDQTPCEDRVTSLAFNRHLLAAGLDNGKILLWDLSTRRRVGHDSMEGAAGRVTDLAFGLDGAILAAVTNKKLRHPEPGVITLWDVASRERIGNPLRGHKGSVSAIAFSADGKMLASGSDSSVEDNIILWDLDIRNANKRFCEIVDCEHERSEVKDELKTSWFQWFYGQVYRRFAKTG
jgi:WD40 repeat protein/GTPase SAR1 family protein